jgi:hypothetical protein
LRYFHVSKAKFGLLTNGIEYRFYSDLVEPNKMDEKPFLEFKITEIKDSQIEEINKSIANIGRTGTSLERVKLSPIYQEWKNLGMTDLEIDSQLNSSLPDELKVKYQDVTTAGKDGNAILKRIGIDPRTGKSTIQEYNLGIPYSDIAGVDTKEIDGILREWGRAELWLDIHLGMRHRWF